MSSSPGCHKDTRAFFRPPSPVLQPSADRVIIRQRTPTYSKERPATPLPFAIDRVYSMLGANNDVTISAASGRAGEVNTMHRIKFLICLLFCFMAFGWAVAELKRPSITANCAECGDGPKDK